MFCHIIPLCFKSHHSKSACEGVLNGAVDAGLRPVASGWTRLSQSEEVQLLLRPVKIPP